MWRRHRGRRDSRATRCAVRPDVVERHIEDGVKVEAHSGQLAEADRADAHVHFDEAQRFARGFERLSA